MRKSTRLFLFIFINIIAFLYINNLHAQEKYRVFFTDKHGCIFEPYSYFDSKAIERRIKSGINLYDSTDFPVNNSYLAKVSQIADSVTSVSRWFNMVYVTAGNEQIEAIKTLPFVRHTEPVKSDIILCEAEAENDTTLSYELENLLKKQTDIFGARLYDSACIDGKGIRIAIFDAGFPNVDKSPAFKEIRDEGRIIKTWDFTKNKEFVYSYSSHGLMVMSCIGGIWGDKKIGLATGAEFLLARTEVSREPFSEEENWLEAVEWADKNGADIINSSLGYTYHRYFNFQMDGKTSLVSQAGNLAARKGILVVNAAGNEGSGNWKFIGTPADADSVLSVGGIDPDTYYHISFSSYGPTSDGRLKPNVCAFGDVAAAGEKSLKRVQGTSFASPLVAGFAACAWQTRRNLTNMELFKEIEKSSSLYPYFDYAHGYGVPQASYFVNKIKRAASPTFNIEVKGNELTVEVLKEYIGNRDKPQLLYYNIQNKEGKLELYKVILVLEPKAVKLSITKELDNKKLNVNFEGYTQTHIIKYMNYEN